MSAIKNMCDHCGNPKAEAWHLVCADCWKLLPDWVSNELVAAHSERVGSERHMVAIELVRHHLSKAFLMKKIKPIPGYVHVCTVRSDDGWEAMCCLWDGECWRYWDSEMQPHGWEPVTDINCVVEDWDLPIMPGSPNYRIARKNAANA